MQQNLQNTNIKINQIIKDKKKKKFLSKNPKEKEKLKKETEASIKNHLQRLNSIKNKINNLKEKEDLIKLRKEIENINNEISQYIDESLSKEAKENLDTIKLEIDKIKSEILKKINTIQSQTPSPPQNESTEKIKNLIADIESFEQLNSLFIRNEFKKALEKNSYVPKAVSENIDLKSKIILKTNIKVNHFDTIFNDKKTLQGAIKFIDDKIGFLMKRNLIENLNRTKITFNSLYFKKFITELRSKKLIPTIFIDHLIIRNLNENTKQAIFSEKNSELLKTAKDIYEIIINLIKKHISIVLNSLEINKRNELIKRLKLKINNPANILTKEDINFEINSINKILFTYNNFKRFSLKNKKDKNCFTYLNEIYKKTGNENKKKFVRKDVPPFIINDIEKEKFENKENLIKEYQKLLEEVRKDYIKDQNTLKFYFTSVKDFEIFLENFTKFLNEKKKIIKEIEVSCKKYLESCFTLLKFTEADKSKFKSIFYRDCKLLLVKSNQKLNEFVNSKIESLSKSVPVENKEKFYEEISDCYYKAKQQMGETDYISYHVYDIWFECYKASGISKKEIERLDKEKRIKEAEEKERIRKLNEERIKADNEQNERLEREKEQERIRRIEEERIQREEEQRIQREEQREEQREQQEKSKIETFKEKNREEIKKYQNEIEALKNAKENLITTFKGYKLKLDKRELSGKTKGIFHGEYRNKKIILKSMSKDEYEKALFASKQGIGAEILKSIIYEENGGHYVIMENLETFSKSLYPSSLKNGNKKSTDLIKQAFLNIKKLYDNKIKYYDSKPDNTVFKNGEIKLIDFGRGDTTFYSNNNDTPIYLFGEGSNQGVIIRSFARTIIYYRFWDLINKAIIFFDKMLKYYRKNELKTGNFLKSENFLEGASYNFRSHDDRLEKLYKYYFNLFYKKDFWNLFNNEIKPGIKKGDFNIKFFKAMETTLYDQPEAGDKYRDLVWIEHANTFWKKNNNEKSGIELFFEKMLDYNSSEFDKLLYSAAANDSDYSIDDFIKKLNKANTK